MRQKDTWHRADKSRLNSQRHEYGGGGALNDGIYTQSNSANGVLVRGFILHRDNLSIQKLFYKFVSTCNFPMVHLTLWYSYKVSVKNENWQTMWRIKNPTSFYILSLCSLPHFIRILFVNSSNIFTMHSHLTKRPWSFLKYYKWNALGAFFCLQKQEPPCY